MPLRSFKENFVFFLSRTPSPFLYLCFSPPLNLPSRKVKLKILSQQKEIRGRQQHIPWGNTLCLKSRPEQRVYILPIHNCTGDDHGIRMVRRPARGPQRVWGVFRLSSREPSGISSAQGATMCRIQAKSFLGHAWSAGASGVGLRLLLDGRFVNDSFIVVTFFATETRRTRVLLVQEDREAESSLTQLWNQTSFREQIPLLGTFLQFYWS